MSMVVDVVCYFDSILMLHFVVQVSQVLFRNSIYIMKYLKRNSSDKMHQVLFKHKETSEGRLLIIRIRICFM